MLSILACRARASASTVRRGVPRGHVGVRALMVVVVVLAVLPAAADAGPAPRPSRGPAARHVSLGDGTYDVTGTVFGEPDDGLVGNETASGHILQAHDHLVALPACTESSCPWLPLGSPRDGTWGPQTPCSEDDGLCWVQLVSLDTGGCTIAPVLDLGPLFRRDNWWAPWNERTYLQDQGVPEAEPVAAGADIGFGPGISDAGYDVERDFSDAPGIDLAEGTWNDLGLPTDQGVGRFRVTLLWQAGISHWDACDGGAPVASTEDANASTTDRLNLRTDPNFDADVQTVIPDGGRVRVTGGPQNGFYPVAYGGLEGWAYGDYLAFDAGDPSTLAFTTDRLNLRSGPSFADNVITVMPEGSEVILTGDSANGFVSVSYQGTDGWAYATYLNGGGD